jgi:hypothetical protein
MAYCCEAFAKEAKSAQTARGLLVPAGDGAPTGQIEQSDDLTWNVNGCCGGGCYVLTGIKFCPFCGTNL